MTQVLKTFGQGHQSRSKFPKKWIINKRTGHISEAIFTYRLHSWYQGITQQGAFNDPNADDFDRRLRSRSNLHKNGLKTKN